MCLRIENICMHLHLSAIFFPTLWITRAKLNICFETIKHRCMSDCLERPSCLNRRYLLCCYGGRSTESSRGVPRALKFYSGKLATGKQWECSNGTHVYEMYIVLG